MIRKVGQRRPKAITIPLDWSLEKCGNCSGDGKKIVNHGGCRFSVLDEPCELCGGHGKVWRADEDGDYNT